MTQYWCDTGYPDYSRPLPGDDVSIGWSHEWHYPGAILCEDISLASGGDYSGDSVTVANYRYICERYLGKLPYLWTHGSSHGGYGLVYDPAEHRVHVQAYLAGAYSDTLVRAYELQGDLEGLDSYCILDEELMGEIESEAEDSAWFDGGSYGVWRDYLDALTGRYPALEEVFDQHENADLASALREPFETARERANVYWENETGNTAYIDVARVAAGTSSSQLLGILTGIAFESPTPVPVAS